MKRALDFLGTTFAYERARLGLLTTLLTSACILSKAIAQLRAVPYGLGVLATLVMLGVWPGSSSLGAQVEGAILYEPKKSDFPCPQKARYAYGKGDCDAYFSWVAIFYRDWTQHAQRLISKVSEDVRPSLVTKLNTLGKTIAAEWAKENGYRRIYTFRSQGYPNMQDLIQRFEEAMRKEVGDGRVAHELLDTAQGVAEKAIRGEKLSEEERVWKHI